MYAWGGEGAAAQACCDLPPLEMAEEFAILRWWDRGIPRWGATPPPPGQERQVGLDGLVG